MPDIFDINSLLAQGILAMGAALAAGNAYALAMDRRGKSPKGSDGELHKGRAWWLLSVGIVISAWGLASVVGGS